MHSLTARNGAKKILNVRNDSRASSNGVNKIQENCNDVDPLCEYDQKTKSIQDASKILECDVNRINKVRNQGRT